MRSEITDNQLTRMKNTLLRMKRPESKEAAGILAYLRGRMASTVLVALCLWGRTDPGLGEVLPKPSIFVAPFLRTGTGLGNDFLFWQPAVSEGLAEMLITELVKVGRFEVLESTALEELRREIATGEEGWVKFEERVKRGEWEGADYVFVATITRFGRSEEKIPILSDILRINRRPSTVQVTQQKAVVQIDWRITDVATRAIKAGGRAEGEHTGTSWSFGWITGGAGFKVTEFYNSTLGKATMQALGKITTDLRNLQLPAGGRRTALEANRKQAAEQATAELETLRNSPGQVIGVGEDGMIVVNLGRKQGHQTGTRLNLYKPVKSLNKKGEVIFTEDQKAGAVVLLAVQDDVSKARLEGCAEVEEGWTVRKD